MYSQGYASTYLLSLFDNENNQRLKITKNPLVIAYYQWIIGLNDKSGFPDVHKLSAKGVLKLKIADSLIAKMKQQIKINAYSNDNPQMVWDVETDMNILNVSDTKRTDVSYFVYPAYKSIQTYGQAYPNGIEVGLRRWQDYLSDLKGYETKITQDALKKAVLKLHDFLPPESYNASSINQLFIFLKQISETTPIGLVFNDHSLKIDANKKIIFELPFYPMRYAM